MLLGVDAATTTGLFALAVAVVGGIVSVIVALVTHDTRRQNRQTSGGVSVLSVAWKTMERQLENAERRIVGLEHREQDCLEALQTNFERIAVLEERLGVHRDDDP